MDDDSGFVTTSKDNKVNFWRLFPGTGDGQHLPKETNPIWSYSAGQAIFNAVTVYREEGQLPTVYVADSNKALREIEQQRLPGQNKDAASQNNNGQLRMTYEESVMYSQLICTKERKVFFAGIAESSRPGAIHMIKYNE